MASELVGDDCFEVMHVLRLRGVIRDDALARATRLDELDLRTCLRALEADELVVLRPGARPSWRLTPSGRERIEQLIAEARTDPVVAVSIERAYAAFLVWNPELLQAATDWQVVDLESGALNDHSDGAYDRAVLQRLDSIHAGVVPILEDLAESLPRFDRYVERLNVAHQTIASGDDTWFTSPTVDSYHAVWHELHEDLLVTGGIARGDEPH